MQPLVSIVTPNYNGAKYLRETLESVLAQTYTNWELIVVDDGSTDDSLELVRSFDEPRFRVFVNERNSGAAVSRNVAIEAARGKYIAFLDGDDLWDEKKLERQIAFMQEKDAAFCFTHYYVDKPNGRGVYAPKRETYGYRDILKGSVIGCSTVLYDAEKLGKRYMPTEAWKREDLGCWLDILRGGERAYCMPEPLTTYRVRGDSVSANKAQMLKWQWHVYRKVEKLGFFRSLGYLISWAFRGVIKYK